MTVRELGIARVSNVIGLDRLRYFAVVEGNHRLSLKTIGQLCPLQRDIMFEMRSPNSTYSRSVLIVYVVKKDNLSQT